MKSALHAVLVSLLLVLVVGTASAMATPPPVAAPATQAAGQSSSSDQSATAGATSTQSSPSNVNIPVRVLSPGNGGSVAQSNSSTALAGAVNLNATQQQIGQNQAGGGSGPATQAAGQDNSSDQTADSTATSTQTSPSNVNIPVRVLSPGNDGSVSQSNDSTAGSLAANLNATDQKIGQNQAGGGGPAVQAAGQANDSTQSADAAATSTQDHAVNYNIPVRVLSPGNDGSVDQSNSSTAAAIGINANLTDQQIGQNQAGGGSSFAAPYVQAAGQKSSSTQDATSTATSTQDHPANYNIPVRVLSPGDDGSVDAVERLDRALPGGEPEQDRSGDPPEPGGRGAVPRTARPGRRPGRLQRSGRHLCGDVHAVVREQHERAGARSEPGRRRVGHAVQQLVRRGARAQREPAVPVDLAEPGWQAGARVAARRIPAQR